MRTTTSPNLTDLFRESAESPDAIRPFVLQLVKLLDESLTIPGTNVRLGLDAALGLIPGIGDALSAALSLVLIQEAKRLGVSRITRLRMLGNVATDALVGAIPLLGDFFDVAFKANSRNLKLLYKHLEAKAPLTIDVTARRSKVHGD